LQADHFPLHVRRTTHSTATGRIAHDVTKLMLVNSGTTIIRHAAGSLALHEGQLALLSAGHWYAGEPLGRVVTTTVYIDTTFRLELGGDRLCHIPSLALELGGGGSQSEQLQLSVVFHTVA